MGGQVGEGDCRAVAAAVGIVGEHAGDIVVDQIVVGIDGDAGGVADESVRIPRPGVDKLVLENAIFTQLGSAGNLNAANFASNATGTAQDANDYLVYNAVTGQLLYDADGNGAGTAVVFANLASHPNISAADFAVI